ncbi:MAG: ATP-binding protein [Firmicutes bacterium]|nr:ATP-binding protein [Bacillota bacterium]
MKKEQYKIEVLPQEKTLYANAGDVLYTLLLVAGLVTPDQENGDRVRLEKGAISPAEDPQAEEAAFSQAELTEGWMLAGGRRICGDAVIYLAGAQEHLPGQPLAGGYGLVVDAGTGTIAAGLVNMKGLNIPFLSATHNGQNRFGRDIPDRLNWLKQHPEDGAAMSRVLSADIDSLICRVTAKGGIAPEEIHAVTLAANHHTVSFWLRDLPRQMQRYCCFSAGELGLKNIPEQAKCYILPDASADIGCDTVAACLSVELLAKKDRPAFTMLVDLGMSSEIILAGRGRILAASVPTVALEGGNINCGTYAVTGAITQVIIEDDLFLHTVRDGKPAGICGAGLISAIHALLDAGMLDAEGRFLIPGDLPPRLSRHFDEAMGDRRLILSPEGAKGEEIYLNQDDVRQFQLAKSGVYAACQALLAQMDAEPGDVEQALLAESYGAHIRPASALAVGLLPALPAEKVRSIGNAAWQGAYLALSNWRCLSESEKLAAAIERVDLSADLMYAESFIEGMGFYPLEGSAG